MEYFIGLLPWLFIYLIGVINLNYNTRQSNDFFFFILFVFSAIRFEVGFDYMSYDHLITDGNEHEIERIEILQQILVRWSRDSFHQFFFVVNSFVTVYFTKCALERLSINLAVSALAFLCFPLMYCNSMNIIRFWTAIAVLFYAASLLFDHKLKKKRFIYFLILLIFALCFHNGAIVGVLLLPLCICNIPIVVNIAVLIIGFVGGEFVLSRILSGVLPDNIYSDQLNLYINKDHQADGLSKIPYLYLIFDVICLLRYKIFKNISKNAYKYLTIFNFGVAIMFLMSFQATLSTRLSRPFMVFFLCLLPYCLTRYHFYNIRFSITTKRLLFGIMSFALLIYLISISNETLGRSQFLPYKVFFL